MTTRARASGPALAAFAMMVLGCAESVDVVDANDFAEAPERFGDACPNGIVHGDIVVSDDETLASLDGCLGVTGHLQLRGAMSEWGALARLQRVGALSIEWTNLRSFEVFEDLRVVNRDLVVRNNLALGGTLDLSAIDLRPVEEEASTDLIVEINPSLRELRLPGDVPPEAHRTLWVSQNGALGLSFVAIQDTAFENVSQLPKLERVDELIVNGNVGLSQVEVEAWCDAIDTPAPPNGVKDCSNNGDP